MLFALALLFDMELLSAMLLVLFVPLLTAALTVRTPGTVGDNSFNTTVTATTAATTVTRLQCPAVVHGESDDINSDPSNDIKGDCSSNSNSDGGNSDDDSIHGNILVMCACTYVL